MPSWEHGEAEADTKVRSGRVVGRPGWVEGAWMQSERFQDVFYEWQSALLDAGWRSRLIDTSHEWRKHFDHNYDEYDPERPIRVPTLALSWQVWNELDLLIVAVRNVLRAQDRLPDEARTQMSGQEVLGLLRNLAEHYDEDGGPSADKLATDHPDVIPGVVEFTNKEIWIGGLPLSRIVRGWPERGAPSRRPWPRLGTSCPRTTTP